METVPGWATTLGLAPAPLPESGPAPTTSTSPPPVRGATALTQTPPLPDTGTTYPNQRTFNKMQQRHDTIDLE